MDVIAWGCPKKSSTDCSPKWFWARILLSWKRSYVIIKTTFTLKKREQHFVMAVKLNFVTGNVTICMYVSSKTDLWTVRVPNAYKLGDTFLHSWNTDEKNVSGKNFGHDTFRSDEMWWDFIEICGKMMKEFNLKQTDYFVEIV